MIGQANIDPSSLRFFRLHFMFYVGCTMRCRLKRQYAQDYVAMTRAQYDRMVEITGGRQTTESAAIWWAFTHTAHHRGQAVVYLRLKGITPPDYPG